MLIIDLERFLAANGAANPKRLLEGIGVDAQNLDTMQGDFRGRRAASTVHTLVGYGATQQNALYRMGRETASDTQYWIAYVNAIDFARSMLASDPTERTYGTGGNLARPAYTDNTYLGSTPYPTGVIELGIPAPITGMTAGISVAGSGATETRVYTSTFVRTNGDESAPSPTVSIDCPGGSTIGLGTFPAPTPVLSNGIAQRRIYVSTGGDFQLCNTGAYTDGTIYDNGVRGAVLQTGGSTQKPAWIPPPDDLVGMIELWAGMHGGFTGKAYRTCVPYYPHAWPVEYQRIVPDRIVGTAKWGQNWLLATTGVPRVVQGSSPLAMIDSPIPFRQACVSKASVRSVGHGVCWASSAGLCYHGQKGTYVMTERILTKAQWRALLPETIIGACWGEWYIGFYNDGTRKGFMINTLQPDGIIWLTQGAYAIFEDIYSETLYLLDSGNVIKKWDAGSVASATFKSRTYRVPKATNPGAARIIGTTYPVSFSLWADGALKVNAQTISNDEPFRLPSGYVAEEFQVQISGTGPIEGVFVADEMADLP